MKLAEKNVIYVGGFGGIGFASCECFLKEGIKNLIIFDVKPDEEKLKSLQSINERAEIHFFKLDLTKIEEIENVFTAAHQKFETIDIVVNGSGIMNEHTIERTVEINLLGVIRSSLTALRFMDKSQGGKGGIIANVSSLVALDTYGAYAIYAATKYGVNGFTRAMADPFYFEQTNVSFITICPSTTETPMLAALRQNPVTTFAQKPPLPQSLQNNQTAEECGKNLVEAIKKEINGSVWILSSGKLLEFNYPEISLTS